MNIIWHGQSCFQITARRNKDEQTSILIDPFSEDSNPPTTLPPKGRAPIGLRLPKLEADILLITHDHPDHNNVKAVGGNPFLITGPGEYEVKKVYIQGIHSFHDDKDYNPPTASSRSLRERAPGRERGENTIYTIEAEDLKLCHLGDLGQKELTEEQLEKIGEVDILMIPVGGVPHQNQWWGTISAKEALKVMSQIEPRITIPMHYALPKLKIKLDPLDKFLKALGLKSITPENKLSIKKKDLSPEEAKIIVLKP